MHREPTSARAACSIFMLALLAAGCGPALPEQSEQQVTQRADELFSNPKSVWTAKPNVTLPITIPVCFENYGRSKVDSTTAQFRAWVQDQVSATWQRYARLNFTGWGACSVFTQPVVAGTKGVPGIHIYLDPPTRCSGTNSNSCGA